MDTTSLHIFLTVARLGSMNKAADSLFLAQSTVTHRLQQLEKEVGDRLFIRGASGVSLTAAGKRLMPVAVNVVEQLRAFTSQSRAGEALSIVAGKAFAAYELPRLLGEYRKIHPHFTCYVRSTLYDESVSALLNGTADLALLGHEVYHPQLHQHFLPSDRILLVVSREHPWADSFPGFIHWGEEPVISFGNQTAPFRQRVDRFLFGNGVFPRIIMELDSIRAVKQMVMQHMGVTLLPERTIAEERHTGLLAAHDISDGSLTRPTLIAYPQHKQTDETFLSFVKWIKAHY